MKNKRDLFDEKRDLFASIQDLEGRALKEDRDLKPDEKEQWDKLYARMDEVIGDIERQEKREKMAKMEALEDKPKETPEEKRSYEQALRNYLSEERSFTAADRQVLQGEKRGTDTQQAGTDNLGGYTVPEEWYSEIINTMQWYSGAFEAASRFGGIINSTTGRKLNIPTIDDTSTKAQLVGETSGTTVQDFTFGTKQLDAYTYRTLAKVTEEMLQDDGYDIEGFINTEFAKRFGRAMNTAATTDNGSSKPNGFMNATSAGVTTAATGTFTRKEILELIENVDRAYRNNNCAFQLSDEALFDIRELEVGSSDGRPLWQPSIREGEPDRIEGYPYIVNNDIAKPSDNNGASNKIMAFGDWSYFKIRMVRNIVIKRLNERYAENLEVGILGFQRWDSELLDTAAIKHMITPAS